MNTEVENCIRNSYQYIKLPANVKQTLGNSSKEYEKQVVNFSIKNQLRYRGNLVRQVRKDEKKYYEELLKYSNEHLMLYPYHLSDIMVKGLRITPFTYYHRMMHDTMSGERSYDSLPNFTAADCLRLLGIGRNQYIDIMNQCRSSRKFFRKKPIKDLLPVSPIDSVPIDPWWISQVGYITEDDIKSVSVGEKDIIDKVIDVGPMKTGELHCYLVQKLYRKGLIYMDVPIQDDDCIVVPPLEGFVMNRVQGDYFETLLYKIFVSIDEHTTVAELANVLEIDLQLVKNAVSMYCRLGFAKRKGKDADPESLHPSWNEPFAAISTNKKTSESEDVLLIDWTAGINDKTPSIDNSTTASDTASLDDPEIIPSLMSTTSTAHSKRIAFLFDSTLTAFLMMGNLSSGLKSHAVTMFEVGKLSDESLDSFLGELEKVPATSFAEGEAQRYFEHAVILRKTISYLRYNKEISPDPEMYPTGLGIDLLRCESLLGLEPATCSRVLQKNYEFLVSMAPLSNEIRPVSSCTPQHIGPAIPEVNSVWFKLFLYSKIGSGPQSLLLVKGSRLRCLPKMFQEYDRLLITTWGHDPGIVATSNALLTINDALSHSAVLIQAHGWLTDGETTCIPFPLPTDSKQDEFSMECMHLHSAITNVSSLLDLKHSCGYITLLNTGKVTLKQQRKMPTKTSSRSSVNSSNSDVRVMQELTDAAKDLDQSSSSASLSSREKLSLDVESACDKETKESEWVLLDLFFGVPLFDDAVNRAVCCKMAENKLCHKDSLSELLQSTRRLSLQLLNFIAEKQDLPVISDLPLEPSSHSNISASLSCPTVSYPTKSLMFDGALLKEWAVR
ncbi:protein FAM91A1-like [Antedon mediterranea]|uniref:protein FAM91A1-like n=1 Tax=Antedon mediterranea TaxID=105859 RepID=UPI003AF9568F